MKYIVDIDYSKCINCLACYLINKNIFSIENNRIVIKNNTISSEEDIEDIKIAAKACPTNAIYYEEISDKD
ncbi:MAG: ferredoxin [Candidatus Nanopusillus sp.]|jgi:ferredoxin